MGPKRAQLENKEAGFNRLKYNRGYLCGAMDRVKDGGIAWRLNIQKELADLDIFWLDPTHKPIDIGLEDLENREHRRMLKKAGQYEIIQTDMRIIRSVDLRMVDFSDFLVVNLDLDVHACGTYEELYLANRQKKPIILRVEQGKQHCPDWLIGTVPHEMIFSHWYEVHEYLRHVALDPVIDHFNRWLFFDLGPKFAPMELANFWSKVKQTSTCWLWGGEIDKHKNAVHRMGADVRQAKRLAFELINGQCDSRFDLLTICKKPLCVNPDHLKLVMA